MTLVGRLKKHKDIVGIWRSGQVASKLHQELRSRIKPGITTKELDDFALDFIRKHKASPTFLGYRGFPAALCISLNDEIVHGIPCDRRLASGDLVSIDLGVTLNGYISDTAFTWYVSENGEVDDLELMNSSVSRLYQGTRDSLYAAIDAIKVGKPLRTIGKAVQDILEMHNLGIVRELTGHGVGFELHESPTIYNFDSGARKPVLQNGQVLAIEPMATLGSEEILLAADDWTYLTADGSLSAHFEHTVALWEDDVFILTDHLNQKAKDAFDGI